MNQIMLDAIPILSDNYVWVLKNTNNEALIVDPGEADPVILYLKEHHLQLKAILITHHHWDHTNGISKLVDHYKCEVIGPAKDKIPTLTQQVEDNEEITVDTFPIKFKVMSIGGHTKGHIAYYGENLLFCGDTLFAAGCGRVFEGTPEEMYSSLMKLKALPDETKVCCAHEYTLNNLKFADMVDSTNHKIREKIGLVKKLIEDSKPSLPSTIASEKETNPFFRCDNSEIISEVSKRTGKTPKNEVECFALLREMKNNF